MAELIHGHDDQGLDPCTKDQANDTSEPAAEQQALYDAQCNNSDSSSGVTYNEFQAVGDHSDESDTNVLDIHHAAQPKNILNSNLTESYEELSLGDDVVEVDVNSITDSEYDGNCESSHDEDNENDESSHDEDNENDELSHDEDNENDELSHDEDNENDESSHDEDIEEEVIPTISQVNQYKVIEEIGVGSYGNVYKVRDTLTDMVFVMKAITHSSSSLGTKRDQDYLKRKVAIMKKLQHPNLVHLHDVVDSPQNNTIYLVMDLVQGDPVVQDSELAAGTARPLPEQVARWVLQGLLVGLQYLHFQGVLHRDIKGSNVMIDRSGDTPCVKLCDYGISSLCSVAKSARILGEDDLCSMSQGVNRWYDGQGPPLVFMPPECLKAEESGSFYHGRPADIWSTGVTLYCLLFGKYPFYSTDIEQLRDSILNSELVIPSTPRTSTSVQWLLERMLDKNATTRITMAGILESQWIEGDEMDTTKGGIIGKGIGVLPPPGGWDQIRTTEQDVLASISPVQNETRHIESSLFQVNQYQVIEEIGHGSQGIVYRVRDANTGQEYAMKTLNQVSVLGSGRDGKKLRKEVAIMKKLQHPNLVRLLDVIDSPEKSKIYIVMDLVEGGAVLDDNDLIQGASEPLPEHVCQWVFRGMVLGMQYLHFHGILHRDVKPANVLMDRSGVSPCVKICDFGVSTLCSAAKSARVLGEDDLVFAGASGTLAMLPPESVGASPDNVYHGRPADIWSLGVTLYCLLYGRLPFPSTDVETLKDQIIHDKLQFPTRPKVSSGAIKLLHLMLEKDPEKRITMAAILEHKWVVGEGSVGSHSKPRLKLTKEQSTRIVTTDTDVQASISKLSIRERMRNSIVQPVVRLRSRQRGSRREQDKVEHVRKKGPKRPSLANFSAIARQLRKTSSKSGSPTLSRGKRPDEPARNHSNDDREQDTQTLSFKAFISNNAPSNTSFMAKSVEPDAISKKNSGDEELSDLYQCCTGAKR